MSKPPDRSHGLACCVNYYPAPLWDWGEGSSGCKPTLYMRLVFHWLCQESRRLIPLRLQMKVSKEIMKGRAPEGAYRGERTAASCREQRQRARQEAKEEHNSFPCCHPHQSNYKSHILTPRHKQILCRAHQKLGTAWIPIIKCNSLQLVL